MVLINAPVGQYDDVGTFLGCPVYRDVQLLKSFFNGSVLIIQKRYGLNLKSRLVESLYLNKVNAGKYGVIDLQNSAVVVLFF